MARYIEEYRLTIEGGKISLPTCSRIMALHKIANYFVLSVEVWGNPQIVYDMDVKVIKRGEYISPESKILDTVLIGSELFYFIYTTGEPIDLGTDGGMPEDAPVPFVPTRIESEVEAGGLKEI